MEFVHTITVALPVEQVWAHLTDLDRVARCVPGATLTGRDEDGHRGTFTITVGPDVAEYSVSVQLVHHDRRAHHAVARAEGTDEGGHRVVATISVTLTSRGAGTEVSLLIALSRPGHDAKVGRAVASQASSTLLTQFAQRLEASIAADTTEDRPAPSPESSAPDALEVDGDTPGARATAWVRLSPVPGARRFARITSLAGGCTLVVLAAALARARRRHSSIPSHEHA
jgi:carbon monoxide dehydrogenase subunit G